MRTSSSSLWLALVAVGLSLAPTAGAAAADEAPPTPAGQAPITVDDTISLYGTWQLGVYATNDAYVLQNDRDPDFDKLTICGLTTYDDQALAVRSTTDGRYLNTPYLYVEPLKNETATYTVTYLACDGESQTPGTLTVNVTRVEPIRVRVPSKGGLLRFVNRGTGEAFVTYGKPSEESFKGVDDTRSKGVAVPPSSSLTVRVARTTVAYWAQTTLTTDNATVFAGSGIVEDIPPRSWRTVPAGS